MRTAILTIKPIDDHGVIDDTKERQRVFDWEAEYEDLVTNIGDFVLMSTRDIEEEIMAEDEDESDYTESLPAFDLTLELREK